MGQSFDLVVRNGTGLTPMGREAVDIGIREGRITALGDLASAPAATSLDATGLTILPGLIDTQVHFREPGLEHKEDLETGTRAAALGGITAVFEMPNTKPPTLDAAALEDKLARARGRAWCDYAFFIGAAAENVDRLPDLERHPGCAGVKLFMGSSTGGLLVEDDATIARVLAAGRRRVAVHAEDEPRLRERRPLAEGHPRTHPLWRDVETARRATERLLRLARAARRPVHVLHVTTAEEMAMLPAWRDVATVEVTPQHLTLSAPDAYERLGSRAQMNPPIREAGHGEALWEGVRTGAVDVLGSDHAPHRLEEKARPYPESPSGMPGVQTLLPVMLDHVHHGRLTLERLVDLLAAGPARIYGMPDRGRLALGYRGDLTLVDLKARRTLADADMASRCGWTPFAGLTVTGWPIATVIGGRLVMRDDTLLGHAEGQPVTFSDRLA